MKVFIQSCHASLEYDMALMFLKQGCQVAGNFDVGSKQRPKIPGVTDKSYPVEVGVQEADVLVMHQVEDYDNVFEKHCRARRIAPVVLNLFGQGCDRQHKHTAEILQVYPNAYAVCYSRTDEARLLGMGAPREKVEQIYFAKDIEAMRDEGVWEGSVRSCFMTCNSFHRRGEGVQWSKFCQLAEENPYLPLVLSGVETEVIFPFGIGELSYDGLLNMYKNMRCFLSFGTIPATYVLTVVEAMCVGTPVCVLDNGCGIQNEEFSPYLKTVKTVKEVAEWVSLLVSIPSSSMKVDQTSLMAMDAANRYFDMGVNGKKWMDLFRKAGAK